MPTYTLGELAVLLNGVVRGNAAQVIEGVASLSCAQTRQLSYLDNPMRLRELLTTHASAVLLTDNMQHACPLNAIVVSNPFLAIAEAIKLFEHDVHDISQIHPSATLDLSALLGNKVSIGAHTTIGDNVEIGDNTRIGANCVIESGVRIGSNSCIQNAVVLHQGTQVGAQVHIDSGAVIGATPFNAMKMHAVWHPGPSIGGVVLYNGCRVGSNTVIDRGSICDTVIAEGVVLDNLIQIAHDAVIGAHTAIAACVVVGAHTFIGKHCIIGGASSIAPSLHLADEVVITGMSSVNKSLLKSGMYSSGTMVSEHKQWRKNAARFKQLDTFVQRVKRIESAYLRFCDSKK